MRRHAVRYMALALSTSLLAAVAGAPVGSSQGERGDDEAAIRKATELREILQTSGPGDEAAKVINAALELLPEEDLIARGALYNLVGNILAEASYHQRAIQIYELGLKTLSGPSAVNSKEAAAALGRLRSSGKSVSTARTAVGSLELDVIDLDHIQALRTRSTGQAEVESALITNLAGRYLLQRQFKQADDLYERAMRVASDLGEMRRRVAANFSWSAIEQQRYGEADRLLREALGGVALEATRPSARHPLLTLGVARRLQGEPEKAVSLISRAASLYEAAKDGRGHARSLVHLAEAHLAAGRAAEAKRLLLELSGRAPADDIENNLYLHAALGRSYRRLGEFQPALDCFKRYLELLERVGDQWRTEEGSLSFRESQDAFVDEYVSTALDLTGRTGSYAVAREVTERVRSHTLAALVADRPLWKKRSSGDVESYMILVGGPARYADAVTELSDTHPPDFYRWIGVPPQSQSSPNTDIEPKERARIEGAAPAANVRLPPVTFLEFYALPERTLVMVKSAGGRLFGAQIPVGREALLRLVNEYGGALGIGDRPVRAKLGKAQPAPQGRAESALAAELYRLLIRPVRARLPATPDGAVVIVPHGPLWLLPFAALANAKGGRLADEMLLSYANSEASWGAVVGRQRVHDHRSGRAWVAGNPALPTSLAVCGEQLSFDSLPWAEKEATAVAALFGPERADLFVGKQADRVRLEAWHPGYGVIHLAAHGVACPAQPLESALVLSRLIDKEVSFEPLDEGKEDVQLALRSDRRLPVTLRGLPNGQFVRPRFYTGLLTASTIVSRYQLNADLVTLSACQTGLGAVLGEGMVGFTRAFQAAGARSLVVSLWSVSDEATSYLMVEFYRQYLAHGNKAKALRKAMAETRRKYPEPRYWAAFSLFGAAE